ncbi:MAG: GNAT family acetyltransferase [Lachnospiraceae bacterium]|nr:GNAT family acetyltransferase [Lachnospiraceae bacterium]
MRANSNYAVVNIRQYLNSDNPILGEDTLKKVLSEFSCPLNSDVERFLKEQAIESAKKQQAVTYLLISMEDGALLGYFSITVKPFVVSAEPFSNTMRRKLARFSDINQEEQSYNMAAYLIAQLGRNFDEKAAGRITGEEITALAIEQLKHIQYEIGGSVSFVEADNKEKLLAFYERCGYKRATEYPPENDFLKPKV